MVGVVSRWLDSPPTSLASSSRNHHAGANLNSQPPYSLDEIEVVLVYLQGSRAHQVDRRKMTIKLLVLGIIKPSIDIFTLLNTTTGGHTRLNMLLVYTKCD